MNKAALVAGVSVLVGSCASPSPPPAGIATATARAPARTESENLDHLRALQIIDVGALIVESPVGARSCYGPCPEDKEKAELRLDKLVAVAEKAAKEPAPAGACEKPAIDANVAALNALKIVVVTGLLVQVPKNTPSCYNQPCGSDLEAARAVTCARAGQLANIVAAAKGL